MAGAEAEPLSGVEARPADVAATADAAPFLEGAAEGWRVADELAAAIMMDQVEVLILTRPGYESGYGYQKTKMVLHSPSGNSFK